MKIQIDPGAQIAVAIGVSVLTAIGKGAIALPLGVPAWVGDYVVSWSNCGFRRSRPGIPI